MRNVLKIVFVIIGTLIGAGFASGQEMYIFFFSYGLKGIIGILISTYLMGLVMYKTLCIVEEKNINTYKDFLDILIMSRNKSGSYIINNITNNNNQYIYISYLFYYGCRIWRIF